MKPISETEEVVLRWSQTGRLSWQLLAGDEVVASLSWAKSWSSHATGESADGSWEFGRVGLLHPKVVVTAKRTGAEAAVARLSWGCSASIETPQGQVYRLQPGSIWRSEWTLTGADGTRVLGLRWNRSWTRDSANVILGTQPQSMSGFSLLAILSWYIVLLVAYDDDGGSAVAASVAAGAI